VRVKSVTFIYHYLSLFPTRERERLFSHMKPSEREKKRYIVFGIVSGDTFSFEDVKTALKQNIIRYIGEFGWQRTRMLVIPNLYFPERKIGIFRITNKSLEPVRSCLQMLDDIDGKKAKIEIRGISGILKKAKQKWVN